MSIIPFPTTKKIRQDGPALFFKYQPITKYTLLNLDKDQLWVSPPGAFNDPFEFKYQLKNGEFMEESEYKDLISGIHYWGIVCLATHPKLVENWSIDDADLHPDNMLMWSHYADHHKGIALGLRKQAIIYSVNYSDQFPIIDLLDKKIPVEHQFVRALHTKQTCWEYENEARAIFIDRHSYGIPCEKSYSVERIYFGLRINESDISLIRNITSGRNIRYYKGYLAENRFEIKFKRI